MLPTADCGILELSRSTLKLRSDLVFTPQDQGGQRGYLLEDRVHGKFYQVGPAEYTLLSLLDGRTTLGDALALCARALPHQALTEQEVAAIGRWLVEADLAHTAVSGESGQLAEAAARDRSRRTMQRFDPLLIKLPLGSPDRPLSLVLPWLGWFFAWPTVLCGIAWALFAAWSLAAQSTRLAVAAEGIFSPDRWLWLGLTWFALKLVHETSHALVCKRYGGHVREAGLLFILLAPIAYVDVTSSWRFRSRWQRIGTAAAGMYAELWIAASAAVVWSLTAPSVLNGLCFQLLITASVTTVLFNANFLMRFDGYYILADLLNVPNLYWLGQQYWRYWLRRYALGLKVVPPHLPAGKALLVQVHGLGALVWRGVVMVTLVVAAASLWKGAGLVLALAASVVWVARSLRPLVRLFSPEAGATRPSGRRLLATSVAVLAGGVLLATVVPWPWSLQTPGIVQYADEATVRAGSPGIVQRVRVTPNQLVAAGQVLVTLENRELVTELADLELAIEQSRLKSRVDLCQQKGELAAQQAELKELEGLEKRRREKQSEVAQLQVRAPVSGRAESRTLESLDGSYLAQGKEILVIGDESHKEIRLSISQDDVDRFAGWVGNRVRVRIAGSPALAGTLARIEPRASLEPPHPSLCATDGGPLPVRPRSTENQAAKRGEQTQELLVPRFTGIVTLTSDDSRPLHAGQRATVALLAPHDAVGAHLYRQAQRWLTHALKRAAS